MATNIKIVSCTQNQNNFPLNHRILLFPGKQVPNAKCKTTVTESSRIHYQGGKFFREDMWCKHWIFWMPEVVVSTFLAFPDFITHKHSRKEGNSFLTRTKQKKQLISSLNYTLNRNVNPIFGMIVIESATEKRLQRKILSSIFILKSSMASVSGYTVGYFNSCYMRKLTLL